MALKIGGQLECFISILYPKCGHTTVDKQSSINAYDKNEDRICQ